MGIEFNMGGGWSVDDDWNEMYCVDVCIEFMIGVIEVFEVFR